MSQSLHSMQMVRITIINIWFRSNYMSSMERVVQYPIECYWFNSFTYCTYENKQYGEKRKWARNEFRSEWYLCILSKDIFGRMLERERSRWIKRNESYIKFKPFSFVATEMCVRQWKLSKNWDWRGESYVQVWTLKLIKLNVIQNELKRENIWRNISARLNTRCGWPKRCQMYRQWSVINLTTKLFPSYCTNDTHWLEIHGSTNQIVNYSFCIVIWTSFNEKTLK